MSNVLIFFADFSEYYNFYKKKKRRSSKQYFMLTVYTLIYQTIKYFTVKKKDNISITSTPLLKRLVSGSRNINSVYYCLFIL